MKAILIKAQLLLFVVLLSSCNTTKNSTKIMDKTMLNGTWVLHTLNGDKIENNTFIKQPKLDFNLTENRVSGNDGCNLFSANITSINNENIVFSPFAGTKMACPNMSKSQEVNRALSRVSTFSIKDSALMFFDVNNNQILGYTKDDNQIVDHHTSENALDWNGLYIGTLPCADCEGIETELTLNQDKTYLLHTAYLGESPIVFNESGNFSWNNNGTTIILHVNGEPSKDYQYKVMENKIVKLDNAGNQVDNALKSHYVLNKTTASSPTLKQGEEIYWVNSIKAECTGVGKTNCLQIRKGIANQEKDWQLFYDTIEGFKFEAGFLYKIIVKEDKRELSQVPADASTVKYTLVKILEKTLDAKLRLHDIWALEAVNNEKINLKNFTKHPELEINLTTNTVSGNDGCNQFSGAISGVDTKKISFKSLISTMMACPDMEHSDVITKHLGNTAAFKLNNLKLSFLDKDGKELLRYKKVD